MRRQGIVAPKNEYIGKFQGVMTEKDYSQAKIYGERAKQKYIVQKHKKSNDSAKHFWKALAGLL